MQNTPTPYPHISINQPVTYRIIVQGWVSIRWEDWFGGLSVTHLEMAQDVTILTGRVEDQAALLGTLQRLYAFGLPILSVELIPSVIESSVESISKQESPQPNLSKEAKYD